VSRASTRSLLRDAVLIAAVTAVGLAIIEISCQSSYHEDDHVYVIVDRGNTFAEIADRLKAAGLIQRTQPFLVLGRLFGVEHGAKAGRYRFEATSDMVDILTTLHRGATYREHILVRPGRRIEGVASVFQQHAEVDSATFVTLATDSAFMSRLGIPSINAEGYLFPATYDIEWQEDAESVLRRMIVNFFRVFDDSLTARARRLGMTVNQAVTLASIIEKEAMLDSERPKISAVFHNRLRIGMKLQADPTVRYALGKWKGRVLYKDLRVDSPFNTYKYKGLPPHPICSPGAASLVAALYPLPDSKYLYFVAQGDGSHFFSETGREHQRAKARYKSYLRSLRQAEADEDRQAQPDSQSVGEPGGQDADTP
jgi:UPF0755 protein